MPDFGIFRGFNQKLFGDKLVAGQLPTQLGLIGSESFGIDPDAQAFITAAGITDATQQAAINTLVVDLKGYNIWAKMKAIYPMVGGTASSHRFNLKDPRDLDAAYRLVFNGGWTHDVNGAQPNGTNGYANTFYVPNNSELTDFSFGYYGNTNETATGARTQIGNYGDNAVNVIIARWNASSMLLDIMWSGDVTSGITNNNESIGLHAATAIATNTQYMYKNGVLINSFTKTTPAAAHPYALFIGGLNVNGSPNFYSDTRHALSFIGARLDATDNDNFYTAVQAFQTTLSRNV